MGLISVALRVPGATVIVTSMRLVPISLGVPVVAAAVSVGLVAISLHAGLRPRTSGREREKSGEKKSEHDSPFLGASNVPLWRVSRQLRHVLICRWSLDLPPNQ